ncbi:MAG: hypothetical protein V3V92_03150 [Candidatus Hydrothermarchaeales archaeon]
MKVLKIERMENEKQFWINLVLLAFIVDTLLVGLLVYLVLVNPDPKGVGLVASAALTSLAIVFIGLKKGVLPVERIHVRI